MKLFEKINMTFSYVNNSTFWQLIILYVFFLLTLNLDNCQFFAVLPLLPATAFIVAVIVAGINSIDTDHFSQKVFEWSFFIAMILLCALMWKLLNAAH